MLEGKRIALLVEEGFEDSVLEGPLKALKDAGARVVVIGNGSQASYSGTRERVVIKVDTSADKVKAEDFDAIVVPGGGSFDKMPLNKHMVDLVRRANDLGKVVAAIFYGARLLIGADIVGGRRVTSLPALEAELKKAGAGWVDEPVVQDGNLITARKPADIPRFNKAIMEALRGHNKHFY